MPFIEIFDPDQHKIVFANKQYQQDVIIFAGLVTKAFEKSMINLGKPDSCQYIEGAAANLREYFVGIREDSTYIINNTSKFLSARQEVKQSDRLQFFWSMSNLLSPDYCLSRTHKCSDESLIVTACDSPNNQGIEYSIKIVKHLGLKTSELNSPISGLDIISAINNRGESYVILGLHSLLRHFPVLNDDTGEKCFSNPVAAKQQKLAEIARELSISPEKIIVVANDQEEICNDLAVLKSGVIALNSYQQLIDNPEKLKAIYSYLKEAGYKNDGTLLDWNVFLEYLKTRQKIINKTATLLTDKGFTVVTVLASLSIPIKENDVLYRLSTLTLFNFLDGLPVRVSGNNYFVAIGAHAFFEPYKEAFKVALAQQQVGAVFLFPSSNSGKTEFLYTMGLRTLSLIVPRQALTMPSQFPQPRSLSNEFFYMDETSIGVGFRPTFLPKPNLPKPKACDCCKQERPICIACPICKQEYFCSLKCYKDEQQQHILRYPECLQELNKEFGRSDLLKEAVNKFEEVYRRALQSIVAAPTTLDLQQTSLASAAGSSPNHNSHPSVAGQKCMNCDRVTNDGKPCPACGKEFFCSQTCYGNNMLQHIQRCPGGICGDIIKLCT